MILGLCGRWKIGRVCMAIVIAIRDTTVPPALYSYQSFLSARKLVGICTIAKSTVGCVAFKTSTVLLMALPSP